MAIPLSQLPAQDSDSGLWNVVVDAPKGSRNKYKYDEKCELWRLSKVLPHGASFPFDFGFIPSTRGQDGDPLDVLVLLGEPTFPGCIVPARLIGILEVEQTQGRKTIRNDRFVAMIDTPFNAPVFRTLEEVSAQWLAEVEHFFISYSQMEGRTVKPLGRHGAKRAQKVMEAAMRDYDAARRDASKFQSRARV